MIESFSWETCYGITFTWREEMSITMLPPTIEAGIAKGETLLHSPCMPMRVSRSHVVWHGESHCNSPFTMLKLNVWQSSQTLKAATM